MGATEPTPAQTKKAPKKEHQRKGQRGKEKQHLLCNNPHPKAGPQTTGQTHTEIKNTNEMAEM